MPGHRPPQVTTAARTRDGSKNNHSRGPAVSRKSIGDDLPALHSTSSATRASSRTKCTLDARAVNGSGDGYRHAPRDSTKKSLWTVESRGITVEFSKDRTAAARSAAGRGQQL